MPGRLEGVNRQDLSLDVSTDPAVLASGVHVACTLLPRASEHLPVYVESVGAGSDVVAGSGTD